MVCMSVHAVGNHTSLLSWKISKLRIYARVRYSATLIIPFTTHFIVLQDVWVASYQTHRSLQTTVCNLVCLITFASMQPEAMNKWIKLWISKIDIHLHNTSKWVSGPYMSHIFLLLTSIPLPECWNIWTIKCIIFKYYFKQKLSNRLTKCMY